MHSDGCQLDIMVIILQYIQILNHYASIKIFFNYPEKKPEFYEAIDSLFIATNLKLIYK